MAAVSVDPSVIVTMATMVFNVSSSIRVVAAGGRHDWTTQKANAIRVQEVNPKVESQGQAFDLLRSVGYNVSLMKAHSHADVTVDGANGEFFLNNSNTLNDKPSIMFQVSIDIYYKHKTLIYPYMHENTYKPIHA